jgi:hypothetical protein
MRVRNFWIEAHIDGRRTTLSGGPRARKGGLSLTLYQRSGGEIVEALSILGRARTDGSLWLRVTSPLLPPGSETELFVETRR